MGVLAEAEEEFVASHVKATIDSQRRRLDNREPITLENIHQVRVLLMAPSAGMVIRAADEGVLEHMVCAFEIVGPHSLAATARNVDINAVLR